MKRAEDLEQQNSSLKKELHDIHALKKTELENEALERQADESFITSKEITFNHCQQLRRGMAANQSQTALFYEQFLSPMRRGASKNIQEETFGASRQETHEDLEALALVKESGHMRKQLLESDQQLAKALDAMKQNRVIIEDLKAENAQLSQENASLKLQIERLEQNSHEQKRAESRGQSRARTIEEMGKNSQGRDDAILRRRT